MNNDFLLKLQKEATFQKKLNEERILPAFFDEFASFIGTYSWQTILVLSILTAIVAEFL